MPRAWDRQKRREGRQYAGKGAYRQNALLSHVGYFYPVLFLSPSHNFPLYRNSSKCLWFKATDITSCHAVSRWIFLWQELIPHSVMAFWDSQLLRKDWWHYGAIASCALARVDHAEGTLVALPCNGSMDVPVEIALWHKCAVLGTELVTGGRPGWHCQPDGLICLGCACWRGSSPCICWLFPAYTGSKVSSGCGHRTCSTLLDVQPRCELWDTSGKAMPWLGLLLELRAWSCALQRCCVSQAGQHTRHSSVPLSAHLCSLQECPDPGAFVNITEPCTVY